MRFLLSFLLFSLAMAACSPTYRNKIYVRTIVNNSGATVDWFVYSTISGFSHDYVQIQEKGGATEKLTLDDLSNINFSGNNTLVIERCGDSLTPLNVKVLNIECISVDTGHIWNAAISRIDRLMDMKVDVKKRHIVDT